MSEFAIFDLPEDLIPSSILEIASYCGKKTALVLLFNYPGVHVRIPKTPAQTHKLFELLGLAEFTKLCEMYGSEIIQIPRAVNAIRSLRNQQILLDFANGMMQSSIAIKYGLTERQINHICNKVSVDSQVDMFS